VLRKAHITKFLMGGKKTQGVKGPSRGKIRKELKKTTGAERESSNKRKDSKSGGGRRNREAGGSLSNLKVTGAD